MLFDADIGFISQLDSLTLVKLMRGLLYAECAQTGIALRSASVPIQITVADGGEDGRAEWAGGVPSTDYLPARFTVFQSKAQSLTESVLRGEILKKTATPKGGPRKVSLPSLTLRSSTPWPNTVPTLSFARSP